MKLHFESNLDYQHAAIESVCEEDRLVSLVGLEELDSAARRAVVVVSVDELPAVRLAGMAARVGDQLAENLLDRVEAEGAAGSAVPGEAPLPEERARGVAPSPRVALRRVGGQGLAVAAGGLAEVAQVVEALDALAVSR